MFRRPLYTLVFTVILVGSKASVTCAECEGLIPLTDSPPPTVGPTGAPTLGPTVAPTPVPTTCVASGANCGGTNSFGVDAAVEACCDVTETCTRRNARRWRCQ